MDNICCVCIITTLTDLTDITERGENSSISYVVKLKSLIPEIEWLNVYKICQNCIIHLNEAYKFKETCLHNKNLMAESKLQFESNEVNSRITTHNISNKDFQIGKGFTIHNSQVHFKSNLKSEDQNGKVLLLESECEMSSEKFDNICDNQFDICDTSQDTSFPGDVRLNEKISLQKQKALEDIIVDNKIKVEVGHKISQFNCEYCGRKFKRREHVATHIRSKHTLEKPYECDICTAKFSISQSLIVHKRRHKNERPYCCTYCGKQFPCSADLYHHNQIHLNLREYKCNSCEKSFNTASILRRHKICAHTDPELWKYVCQHCDRRFPMSGNLKTHLRRHDNEKNFTCTICDKSFYDKFILQRHMRSHTDERLFKCCKCEKEYKDNCSLNIHLKKVHDIGNASLKNRPKNFVCHICPKAFISSEKLQKHINSHSGFRPFKCDFCDKSFTDGWYQRKHLEKKHNILG